MVRFLLTADWHIGMPAHFLGAEAAPRFAAARVDAVQAALRLAREQGCAFALACGDLVHSNFVERQTVNRFVQAIADSPLPLYILPGNHDPLEPGSVYTRPEFRAPAQVRLLDRPGLVPVPEAPGVEILAAPCLARHALRDLADEACASVEPAAAGTLRLLAAHGAVDRYQPRDRALPDVVRIAALEEAVRERRIHFAGLGDRHSTTDLALGRVWYPGAPETTAFEEDDPGNVLVVTLDGPDCRVDKHHVGAWRFVRQDFDLGGEGALEQLERWLGGMAEKSRTAVRLALRGTIGLAGQEALRALLARFDGVLAALEPEDADLAVLPDDYDFGRLQLGGYAAAVRDALMRQAEAGPDEKTARDALALLFRLAGTGSA